MGTHASERGGMAIATDRKDMGRCEMDGTNGMVHTSDISKRDEEIRSRDFYLEMSTPGAVSAKVGPSRPSGMVGEEARGLDGGDGGSPKSDATPSTPGTQSHTLHARFGGMHESDVYLDLQ